MGLATQGGVWEPSPTWKRGKRTSRARAFLIDVVSELRQSWVTGWKKSLEEWLCNPVEKPQPRPVIANTAVVVRMAILPGPHIH